MRQRVWHAAGTAALALGIVLGALGAARASLETPGFRAVGVAHSAYPISALAVAPDGRLFATVQELGPQPDPDTPTSAEIRVYQSYSSVDGSTLDEGTVWATITDVRATNGEEGLLGIALAPDFATSKLVYVYVTTTADDTVATPLGSPICPGETVLPTMPAQAWASEALSGTAALPAPPPPVAHAASSVEKAMRPTMPIQRPG